MGMFGMVVYLNLYFESNLFVFLFFSGLNLLMLVNIVVVVVVGLFVLVGEGFNGVMLNVDNE